ncbi:MAG: DNA methyltransferase [bacterium]
MKTDAVLELETNVLSRKFDVANSNSNDGLLGYIESPKGNPKIKEYAKIYNIHKYWSRKPWYPIAECIKKYSNEKDIVVDMFMGSGVTGLEAVIQNRGFIGYDLNPMSVFIAHNTFSTDFNLEGFLKDVDKIKKKIEPIAKDYYSVSDKCDVCSNYLMIKHSNIGPKHKGRETVSLFCYSCNSDRTKLVRDLKKSELQKINMPKDLGLSIPDRNFPKRFYKDRFSYKGVSSISDMYTRRNYVFLGILLEAIRKTNSKYKDLFLTAFSNTVLHASKLKSENVRPLNVNNYWMPDDYFEENPWFRFLERIDLVLASKNILMDRINGYHVGQYEFHNQSCFNTKMDSGSVDYILTDPPYGDAIQYSELSFIWNAWMGFRFDTENEVIINPAQGKGINDFLDLLEQSVKEAARILKKDKFYTLCFHNKDFHIWKGVLDIFKRNNFVLESVDIVDTKGNPYNSNWALFSPKSDLYLTFRKGIYKPRFYSEHSIMDFMRNLSKEISTNNPAQLYDFVAINLINDMYFNEYQVEVNGLNLKTIFSIYQEVKRGD